MIISLVSLIFGCALFAMRDVFPRDLVLAYPLLSAAPVLWHRFLDPRRPKMMKAASFLVDLHDVYLSLISFACFVSLLLWLYVPEESAMLAIQRPQLYAEFLNYTQHAGFAVLLFSSAFSIGHRALVGGTPEQARNLLECSLPSWVYTRLNVGRAALIICGISSLSYICRYYAYSQGQVNFDSAVDFGYFGRFWALFSIISSLGVLCPGALFVLTTSYRARSVLVLAWGLLGLEMAFGAVVGMKSVVLLPAVSSYIGYAIGKRALPRTKRLAPVLVLVVFLVIMAQTTRFAYREGITVSSSQYWEYWHSSLVGDKVVDSGESGRGMSYYASRFNVAVPIMAAAAYVDRAGAAKEWGGYANVAFSLVPSFLFPWKPLPFSLNDFGRRTGMLAEGDMSTSVRPTVIGDAYYNFGLWGCSGVGLLCGLLTGFIAKIALTTLTYGKPMLIYVIIFSIIDIENAFSYGYGGLIKNTVMILIILKVCSDVPMTVARFGRFSARRGLEGLPAAGESTAKANSGNVSQ